MINLSMESNIRAATARIDALSEAVKDKATLRAINRAVDAVATEANREIRKVYRISARAVRNAITKKRATRKQAVMTGEVIFKGRRLNLVDFGGRQTKRGVSVQVMVQGGRKVIPGTWIATMGGAASNAGWKGIFRRVGRARYPIVNLRSISIPQTVRNKLVDAAIRRVANDTFRKNFEQQIRYLSQTKYTSVRLNG